MSTDNVDIKFNTWRQDLYDAEGDLIASDVLFIRGEMNHYAVQAPLFKGEQNNQDIDDLTELIKRVLIERISHTLTR